MTSGSSSCRRVFISLISCSLALIWARRTDLSFSELPDLAWSLLSSVSFCVRVFCSLAFFASSSAVRPLKRCSSCSSSVSAGLNLIVGIPFSSLIISGVIAMHISVFFFSFAERLNREPNSGRSPKIGSLVMFLISSSLSRPAITSVSPDLSRTWVFSLRVDTCGAELLPDSIHLVIVDTSGSSERVISPFCRSAQRRRN